MDTNNRGAGVALNGRIAGKMNINTNFDIQPFLALCDGNSNGADVTTDGAVQNVWNAMLTGTTVSSTIYNSFARTPYGFTVPPPGH